MWLVMMCMLLWRGFMAVSCSCRVLLRTRAAMVRLRTAGGACVGVTCDYALRSARLEFALVGAASCTNGLGLAFHSTSMC